MDGDGVDEIVLINSVTRPPGASNILLDRLDGTLIEQINFVGRFIPEIQFLDCNGDRKNDAIIPYVRNDSLFVSIVDANGAKIAHFFLIDGQPRYDDGGEIPWDPKMRTVHVADVDHDGSLDLITVIATGYARAPRGVLVHRISDGKALGQSLVGAHLDPAAIGDFDGDGYLEVFASAGAIGNGANAGGFDDEHDALIFFKLEPQPRIFWSRINEGYGAGGNLSIMGTYREGTPVALISPFSSQSLARKVISLELFDLGTQSTVRRRTFPDHLVATIPGESIFDTQHFLIGFTATGEGLVIDRDLEITSRHPVPYADAYGFLPDVTGDGTGEIVGIRPDIGVFLLDSHFRVLARFRRYGSVSTARRGFRKTPYVAISHNGILNLLEMVPNPYYWVFRYGPYGLWTLGLLLAVGLITGANIVRRRFRLLKGIRVLAADNKACGWMILDAQGRITWVNAGFCEVIGWAADCHHNGVQLSAVREQAPELASFIEKLPEVDPPRHQESSLHLHHNETLKALHAAAVPMMHARTLYWLITLSTSNSRTMEVEARTWALMARKVTHDIKNPLTGILLTAQRLQTEYRKSTSVEELDTHTEHIIEQVERLRLMTKQYLKLLDTNTLNCVRTDLSALVASLRETLKSQLPPDTEIEFCLDNELPATMLDEEQVHMIIENLVVNAAQAMPEGGKISVSTYVVSNLQLARTNYTPCEYVVLDVRDHGVGISEEDQEKLFTPGFTTLAYGTGLGLALVYKAVDHHGGFIEVESDPGIGSAFSIHLPVSGS